VNQVPPSSRRPVHASAVGLLLLGLLARCRPEQLEDPLSVLPPPCTMWGTPGADGCLSVREDAQGFEFRYQQAAGTVATVVERQSAGALLTEMKLNGITTWVRSVAQAQGGSWRESAISEFEYPTGRLLREEHHRRSPAGDAILATARRVRTDGGTAEASWESPFPRNAAVDGASAPRPLLQMQGCSTHEVDVLQAELKSALRAGVACMVRHERSDVAALLLSRYQRGPVVLACVDESSFLAATDAGSYLGIIRAAKVSFDKNAYFGRPAGGPIPTMLHELLHLWTGPHAPYIGVDTRSTDPDRTAACVSLCFAPAERVSRGDCALCLGVPRDDVRCNGFVD
jgi:hypothetical protein